MNGVACVGSEPCEESEKPQDTNNTPPEIDDPVSRLFPMEPSSALEHEW